MKQEIENRIAIYALISRLMLVEVDTTFLEQIENNEDLLSLFPNYKAWDKRKELSPNEMIEEHFNVDFTNYFLCTLFPMKVSIQEMIR